MPAKIAHFIILSIIFINGCRQVNTITDAENEPEEPKTSGVITINSHDYDPGSYGFSFSQGRLIQYPNPQNIIPDILVWSQIIPATNIAQVYLSSKSDQPSFHFIWEFENADSANNFFLELPEAPDAYFIWHATPLRENQVWVVKTLDNRYAKLLITKVVTYIDSSDQFPKSYGETTFKWIYQPDDTGRF